MAKEKTPQEHALGRLAAQRRKADAATGEMTAEIRHAHANGASLRVIARSAGLTHEVVRRIVGAEYALGVTAKKEAA